jgi:hypothetical protein
MHRQFAELCKQIYVEVASADYGLRGRPTNTSRVALLTGLDRKEIKRLRDLLHANREATPPNRQDRITRVLSGWFQDPEFSHQGEPLELAIEDDGPSFTLLVQRYGGDVPASALLRELRRLGAVEDTGSGRLRALKRYYMPMQSDPEALQRTGSVLQDLGTTAVYNLYRPDGSPSRFEGRATNSTVDPRAVAEFRIFVETEAQHFLERVDAWLSAHEGGNVSEDELIRLGLGVYWIEGQDQPGA